MGHLSWGSLGGGVTKIRLIAVGYIAHIFEHLRVASPYMESKLQDLKVGRQHLL